MLCERGPSHQLFGESIYDYHTQIRTIGGINPSNMPFQSLAFFCATVVKVC